MILKRVKLVKRYVLYTLKLCVVTLRLRCK